MKYGIAFSVLGLLLAGWAIRLGGWHLLLLWPAASLCAVAIAYLGFGVSVFGKRADGTIHVISSIILLPYLAYVWATWHLLRLIVLEEAFHEISKNLTIGRRLLPSEFPGEVEAVVDLTCELCEPSHVRTSYAYYAFPMLDGVVPSAEALAGLSRQLDEIKGHIYIHCAQGHGRTGLVAAALLLQQDSAKDVAAAVALIVEKRPAIRFGRKHLACLASALQFMEPPSQDINRQHSTTSPNPW